MLNGIDISSWQNAQGFAPNTSTDKTLTVANLSGAKVTSSGIIYFKQS